MKTDPIRQCHPPRLTRLQGAAVVEFALLLPLLLAIAFGIVEYGRALYHYNALVKAARDGVRLLAQGNPSDPDYDDLQQQARCLVVHGNPDCSGPALAPGLTPGLVRICDRLHTSGCPGDYANVPTGAGVINLVEVGISGYQYPFLGLPYLPGLGRSAFSEIRATMRQIT